MGRRLSDGTIINSYFKVVDQPSGSEHIKNPDQFLLGQIKKVYYTDDKTSSSKAQRQFVVYDVSVREGDKVKTISNVKAMSSFSGTNNFTETILEHNEIAFKGKLDIANVIKMQNGTFVIIAFLGSKKDQPFIIGSLPHPRRDGLKKEDNIFHKSELRGIQTQIAKDGAISITYKGSRKPNSEFETPNTAPTVLSISNTGAFSVTDKENQFFKMDRVTKSVGIEQWTGTQPDDLGGEMLEKDTGETEQTEESGEESKLIQSIQLDKEAKTIILKSGMDGAKPITITIDGINEKIEIVTTSKAKLTVDGKNDKIEAEDSAGGKLKISAGKVALGGTAAELLEQVSQTLIALQAETHLGNLGYATGIPLNSATYAAIQALIDAIKGTI